MTLAEKLEATEAAHKAASLAFEKTRKARNAAVREALADGWSYGRVATVTGLSRGRIAQIAKA